jgi:hypothetical protein
MPQPRGRTAWGAPIVFRVDPISLEKVMKAIVKILLTCVIALLIAATAYANPFRYGNGRYCGECTDGVWILWVEYFGHSTTPSTGHAYKWYDGGLGNFKRGSAPRSVSILCIDRWNNKSSGKYGHVGFVHQVQDYTANWGAGWSILSSWHYNWSPSTRGNCNAQFQHFWLAYHEPSRTVWFWMNGRWSSGYPVRGFVYSNRY